MELPCSMMYKSFALSLSITEQPKEKYVIAMKEIGPRCCFCVCLHANIYEEGGSRSLQQKEEDKRQKSSNETIVSNFRRIWY